MVTPAAIVTGAWRVSIASERLDAVGEALATRVSRRPHAGRLGRAGVAPTARRPLRLRGLPRTQAPPTTNIVSARAVKRWGPPLNVWSRFASFPRCASRLH